MGLRVGYNGTMRKYLAVGPVLIFVAAILWAVDGIFRRNLYTLPPITIVFFEHLIGAIIIFPFFWQAWKKGEHLTKKEIWAIVLVSFLSGLIGTLLFTAALQKTYFISFSVVYLLQKLQPIFTVIVAAIVLKERITRPYIMWAALAIIAAYFVTFKNGFVDLSAGSGPVIAALLALGAAIAWASSTAFSRYTLLNHSQTFITGLRFLLTVPMALIAVYILNAQASLIALSSQQFMYLTLIALTTGMVALWIYYRGLKFTQAKISTIVELAFPVTAIFIGIFLYKDVLVWSQWLAAVVLLFAVYKVSRLNRAE